MQNPLALVSIEEIVRRKSYKDNIDKLNVDIKHLINPDFPRYTNLLFAPNSQRLLLAQESLTTELKSNTVYLRQENFKLRRRQQSRSKQRIIKTEAKPTPEGSFRESIKRENPSPQHQNKQQIKPFLEDEPKHQTKPQMQQKMNKTLNAFLFQIELPGNQRANSCQPKKRVKYIRELEGVSPQKGEQQLQVQQKLSSINSCTQQAAKPDIPRPPRRQQKIPDFIRINLQLDDKHSREIPKASLVFAQRRTKSVIRFRKRKQQQLRDPSKQIDKLLKYKDRLRDRYQNSEEYKRFATIQPQISEVKLLDKCEIKPRRSQRCPELIRPKAEMLKHKLKLRTEKVIQHGDICGWNNQENEDNLNFL